MTAEFSLASTRVEAAIREASDDLFHRFSSMRQELYFIGAAIRISNKEVLYNLLQTLSSLLTERKIVTDIDAQRISDDAEDAYASIRRKSGGTVSQANNALYRVYEDSFRLLLQKWAEGVLLTPGGGAYNLLAQSQTQFKDSTA